MRGDERGKDFLTSCLVLRGTLLGEGEILLEPGESAQGRISENLCFSIFYGITV
jgi:hypothetical protein